MEKEIRKDPEYIDILAIQMIAAEEEANVHNVTSFSNLLKFYNKKIVEKNPYCAEDELEWPVENSSDISLFNKPLLSLISFVRLLKGQEKIVFDTLANFENLCLKFEQQKHANFTK